LLTGFPHSVNAIGIHFDVQDLAAFSDQYLDKIGQTPLVVVCRLLGSSFEPRLDSQRHDSGLPLFTNHPGRFNVMLDAVKLHYV
jgi:hypothetical protein